MVTSHCEPRLVVGVDFGGTRLKAGVIDEEGTLRSQVEMSTLAHEDVPIVLERIARIVLLAIEESSCAHERIAAVTIGACGLVDRASGRFISSSVMPGWRDVPLAEAVSRAVSLPVLVENDASAAIFGEWWRGVGQGARNLVGMTLGTGIGGGIILDSHLFRGSGGNAGEFGHLSINPDGEACFCGNRGCLGLVASASGLVRRCVENLRRGLPSSLSSTFATDPSSLSARAICDAAMAGDALAMSLIDQTGKYLGIGAAHLLSAFNPDMVIFTGGLTAMGDVLLSRIRREARQRAYPHLTEMARIEFGLLQDSAGTVGAAGIFFSQDRA